VAACAKILVLMLKCEVKIVLVKMSHFGIVILLRLISRVWFIDVCPVSVFC
jgi:hypothetical protein